MAVLSTNCFVFVLNLHRKYQYINSLIPYLTYKDFVIAEIER